MVNVSFQPTRVHQATSVSHSPISLLYLFLSASAVAERRPLAYINLCTSAGVHATPNPTLKLSRGSAESTGLAASSFIGQLVNIVLNVNRQRSVHVCRGDNHAPPSSFLPPPWRVAPLSLSLQFSPSTTSQIVVCSTERTQNRSAYCRRYSRPPTASCPYTKYNQQRGITCSRDNPPYRNGRNLHADSSSSGERNPRVLAWGSS